MALGLNERTSLPLPESLFSLRVLDVLISAAPPFEVISIRPIPSLNSDTESSLVEAEDDFRGDDGVLVIKGFVLTLWVSMLIDATTTFRDDLQVSSYISRSRVT